MQVVRGDFIVFFNQIFDALCKLSADSDANVQSAAHLLDRLVKVYILYFNLDRDYMCFPLFCLCIYSYSNILISIFL